MSSERSGRVRRTACGLPWVLAVLACGPAIPAGVVVPRPAPERVLEPELAAALQGELAEADAALAAGDAQRAGAAMLALGMRYDAGAQQDLAREAYRSALRLLPHAASAAVHLARMEQELGDPEAALAALDGVQVDGAFGAAVAWRRGLLLLGLDRLDEAEAAFQSACALAPADLSGWIGLARVALQRGDAERAAACAEEAFQREPGDRSACDLLARAARQRGDLEAAARFSAAAGESSAAWRDPWIADLQPLLVGFANDLRRAEALLAAGRQAEALGLLERLASDRPDHATIASMRSSALLDLGRLDEAQAVIDAALVQHPELFRLHLNRALVLQRRGDARAALASAQRASALLPGYAAGHALVAELLADVGAAAAARAELERARALGASARVLIAVEAKVVRAEGGR